MNFNKAKKLICVVLTAVMLFCVCAVGVSAGVAGAQALVIGNVNNDFEAGYTGRDETVAVVEDGSNKVLKQSVETNGANMYFELCDNDGNPVELNDNKIYVVTMSYKLVNIGGTDRSQPTVITLVRNTAKGGELVKVKAFTGANHFIGDTDEWRHTSVVFKSSIASAPEYNRIGVNVVSLSCPETATGDDNDTTVILFDNIAVTECNENTKALEFVSNGGTACDVAVGQAGEAVSLPTPTRDLCTFDGWYSDVELKNAYTKTTMPSLTSTKLYAKWTPTAEAILVKFDSGIGKEVPYLIGRAGDKITLPKIQRDGYHFAGWYNKELTQRQALTAIPDKSVTLYAKWEVIPIACTFENSGDYPAPDDTVFTKRCLIRDNDSHRGSKALDYTFTRGSSTATHALAGVIIYDDEGNYINLKDGTRYKISFNYKVVENSKDGVVTFVSAVYNNSWGDRKTQSGNCQLKYDASDVGKGWQSHTLDFTWATKNQSATTAYIAISGDGSILIDDIIIYEAVDSFNPNKAMLSFETNQGPCIDSVYADYGTEYELPTLEMEGYRFLGWCLDEHLGTFADSTVKLDKAFTKLYAAWYKIVPIVSNPTPDDEISSEPQAGAEPQPQPQPDTENSDNGWILWVGIGVAVIVVLAVVILVIIMKKKPNKAEAKTEETDEKE